jgi:hypothetical protein
MNHFITMSRLGRQGRWGNQVFQYMFVRSYANRYSLNYQVPSWMGQELFGLDDPPISVQLPEYHEERVPGCREDVLAKTLPPEGDEVAGHDFIGYAQFHTSYYRASRTSLRNLFTLTDEWDALARPAGRRLREGGTVIGIHLRRGDTGRLIFYLTPNEWYLQWLDAHWGRFDKPVLFVATENPSDVEAFRRFNPVTLADLGAELTTRPDRTYNYLHRDLRSPTPTTLNWFWDWWMLTYCRVVLMGNSTFAYTAAMIGYPDEVWRSRLSTQSFVQIDPWNGYPLTREDVRDFPNIPGTTYQSNVYWNLGEGEVPPRE